MGNALFRCCTQSSKAGAINRRRRSLWDNILSNCGLEAPSKRSRLAFAENLCRREPGLDSGWLLETMSSPGWRGSVKQRRLIEYGVLAVVRENLRDSLVQPMSEGHEEIPGSDASPIHSRSPDKMGEASEQHGYEQQHVCRQTSSFSPLRAVSPDKTRISFDDILNLLDYPTSRSSSNRGSFPDLTCSSPIRGSSPDTMRRFFNQHFSQQRHPASTKKRQSPRRSSGKPRRKRTGMCSNSRSPGRAVGGRVEDSVGKRTGMRSPPSKKYGFRTLGKLIKDGEEQNDDMRFLSARTCISETLRRTLNEIIEDREVNSDVISYGYRSPRKTLRWSMEDNEHGGAPCTTTANDIQVAVKSPLSRRGDSGAQYAGLNLESRVVVTSPISRRAALALIGRQRGIGHRKNAVSLGEYGRRSWTPALESILEAADVENLQLLESCLAKRMS